MAIKENNVKCKNVQTVFRKARGRPDQDVVEAFSQHAREVLVVDSVEQLGLIQVAAQGVSHTGVSQSA